MDAKFVETRDRLSAAKLGLETVKNEKNELMREEDRLLDAARRKSSESRDRELEVEDAISKMKSAGFDASNTKAGIEEISGKKRELSRDLIDLEKNRVQIKSVISDIENTLRDISTRSMQNQGGQDSGLRLRSATRAGPG